MENGNPNGDPDAGNMPRVDPETGIGIVSDVCLKRKVRNYVDLVKGESIDDVSAEENAHGYKIYVQEKAVLNDRNNLAYVNTITRRAVTNEKDIEKERTMGRKQYVPYGLYRAEGFISASLAEKTGFSDEDLKLLWEALMNMFEDDRSAARGLMTSRKLIVFKHESKLGNAPAHVLFDAVHVDKNAEGPARKYSDYDVVVDEAALPEGVTAEVYDWIRPAN